MQSPMYAAINLYCFRPVGEMIIPPIFCLTTYFNISYFRYFAFFSEQAALKKFCTKVLHGKTAPGMDDSPGVPSGPKSPIRNFRERLWNIVDNNESSVWAKVLSIFRSVLMYFYFIVAQITSNYG